MSRPVRTLDLPTGERPGPLVLAKWWAECVAEVRADLRRLA